MSDIFDEDGKENICGTKEITSRLQKMYLGEVKEGERQYIDLDERQRRTQLAIKWPDNDLVRQIILDAARLMKSYDIKPGDVKW